MTSSGHRLDKITWGDLRTLCESAGVQDGDFIDLVEIAWGRPEQLTCRKDEDFGWQIILDPSLCGDKHPTSSE